MDFIDILIGAFGDPLLYTLLFFLYAVAAAVFLPIPVEIGLFNPVLPAPVLITILALGKGAGAFIVFLLGSTIRKTLKKWELGTPLMKKIVAACETFVRKYGYIGLLIIMSTPLMIDSLTLYLFSLLNPSMDGTSALTKGKFVAINIIAGALRGTIVLIVAYVVGIRLV
ncbi:MAG: hypothetical protein JXA00_00145 [Candidatus Thermoplasmatota archaeon]|nr:hypothetical protein [Candidatus Thermoplasmatota archaeon]